MPNSPDRPLFDFYYTELRELFEATPSFPRLSAVRVLFALEHELRPRKRMKSRKLLEEVIALRQKLWPHTEPPESSKGAGLYIHEGWRAFSVLIAVGYSVRSGGPSQSARRAILASVIEGPLPLCHDPEYMARWGAVGSLQRLLQTATNIAAYCRIAKLREANLVEAIAKWEADLAWLKAKYYTVEFARQGAWPSTEP
jgi:hypothetical protein